MSLTIPLTYLHRTKFSKTNVRVNLPSTLDEIESSEGCGCNPLGGVGFKDRAATTSLHYTQEKGVNIWAGWFVGVHNKDTLHEEQGTYF